MTGMFSFRQCPQVSILPILPTGREGFNSVATRLLEIKITATAGKRGAFCFFGCVGKLEGGLSSWFAVLPRGAVAHVLDRKNLDGPK